MKDYKKIGERLRKLRIYLDLTQEQVAEILQIGRDAIIRIEKGERRIDIYELSKFSKLYCVPVDELISDESQAYNGVAFARGYYNLDESDKLEIINLIEYKNFVKGKKGENEL